MTPIKIQTCDGLHPVVNDAIVDFYSSILVGDRAKLLLHDGAYLLTTRPSLMKDAFSAQIIETLLPVKRQIYETDEENLNLEPGQIFLTTSKLTTDNIHITLQNNRNTLAVKLQNMGDTLNTTLKDNFFKPLVALLTMDFLQPVLKSTAKLVRKFKSRMIR